MGRYVSTITFEHNDSLKCVARDYESDTDPVLRGYSLDVKLVFESLELDTNFTNVPLCVIQDIKTYLKDNFHCALIVGEDDPQREDLEKLSQLGLAYVKIRPYVSLEKFAEYISNSNSDDVKLSKYDIRIAAETSFPLDKKVEKGEFNKQFFEILSKILISNS